LHVGPTKQELLEFLKQEGATVYLAAKKFNVAKNTILNRMKKWDIRTPKGFFSTGKQIGRPKGIPMSAAQKQLRSRLFSGKGNPFYEKAHSNATRVKMSENHADFSGEGNPFKRSLKDPKKRTAHQKRCQAIWDNRGASWRERFSAKLSKSHAESNSIVSHKNHQSGVCPFNKSSKGWIHFRSSWERTTVEVLDRSVLVEHVEYESLSIPYTDSKGRQRYAKSDFFITFSNGEKLLLEVKPAALVALQHDKIAGHEEYCILNGVQYLLFMEQEIKSTSRANNLLRMAYEGKFYVEKIIGQRFGSVAHYVKTIP